MDFEGWQGRYADNSSEISFTVLDTRRLHGLSLHDRREDMLHNFHFMIRENGEDGRGKLPI